MIISPSKYPLSAETIDFAPTSINLDISNYSSCTTDEWSKKYNYLGKYHRRAFWIFGIISPPKCPLSVETINFAPTTLNFDIPNHFCTKDERSKKSNYLGKYHRYEFWIFGIISPPKFPLSVGTTNLAPKTLHFDISNHSSCTTDERGKKSNNLEKYHRYAFWIFGIILPPQCPLSVETTNFAPTTLNFDESYCSRITDERSKNSNTLEKYHRYAFWIFRIISPAQFPLSIQTTDFAPTTLNFDISNYFCTKNERSKKSNHLGKYHRYEFWIFGSISPLKCPLSVGTTNLAPTTLHFDISNYSSCIADKRSKNSNKLEKHHRYAF